MIRLSELLGAEVRDARGDALGVVRDVRVRKTAGGAWEVDRLLLGRAGLAHRLGLPTSTRTTDENSVAWHDVRSLEDGVLTVAAVRD
jgi:sporulation protein YlmC with PRC-barrel domain